MEKQETKNKEKKRFFFQFHLFSQLHLFRKRRWSVPEEAALKAADALGYPVTVRPSFVLGRRRGRWRSPPRTRTRRGNVGNAVEVAARTGPSWRTRVRSLFFFSSARRSCSPRPPPRSDRTKRANERKRKRASGEGKFKSLITFSSRKGASLSSSHSHSLSRLPSLPFPCSSSSHGPTTGPAAATPPPASHRPAGMSSTGAASDTNHVTAVSTIRVGTECPPLNSAKVTGY